MAVHHAGVDVGHFACLHTGCPTKSGHLGERSPILRKFLNKLLLSAMCGVLIDLMKKQNERQTSTGVVGNFQDCDQQEMTEITKIVAEERDAAYNQC